MGDLETFIADMMRLTGLDRRGVATLVRKCVTEHPGDFAAARAAFIAAVNALGRGRGALLVVVPDGAMPEHVASGTWLSVKGQA